MQAIRKQRPARKQPDLLLTGPVPFAVEEAYKALRTNLLAALPENGCRVIEVTSAEKEEGKTVTAINLAAALRKNGGKVLLMDCDFRASSVAKKLRIPAKPGLAELLSGRNSTQEVLCRLPCGVDVIPAGTAPSDPSERLGSERMTSVLKALAASYDFMLLDTPPVNLVTDAAVLSRKVSGVVLTVRQGLVKWEQVDSAVRKLNLVKANLLGFVLTDADWKP